MKEFFAFWVIEAGALIAAGLPIGPSLLFTGATSTATVLALRLYLSTP